MNISQIEEVLHLVSIETNGYGFIHVIQDVRIHETTVAKDIFTNSSSTYTFLSDGYFIITEIKLPLVSGTGYYINGESVYNPNGQEISIEDLLLINPSTSNIVRSDQNYISLFLLKDYYLKLLKTKYLKNICNCGCGCIDKIDKVQLDTLTMGLDLIEALEVKSQYFEIQRIVEKLSVCFGLITSDCNC